MANMDSLMTVLVVIFILLVRSEAAITITGSEEYGISGQPFNLTCTLTTSTLLMSFVRTGASYSGSVQVAGDKCYNANTASVCTPSVCSCINDGAGKGSQFSWIITPDLSMHLSTWYCKDFEENESEGFTLRVAAAITITGSEEYGMPGQPFNLTCTLTTSKTLLMSFVRTGASYSRSVQVAGDKCYNANTATVCTPSVCSCINDGAGKGSQFSWIITPDRSMHLSTWYCNDFEENESERFTLRVAAAITITGSEEYGMPGQPFNLTCSLTTSTTLLMSFVRTGASYSGSVQVAGDKCYNANTATVCTPSVCSCINDGAGKGSQFSWIIIPDRSMHIFTWYCKDFENNESEEFTLRVAALVTSVTLQNPPVAGSDLALTETTSTNLVCVTSACRPSADVQWYIGNTNYTSSSSYTVSDVTGNLHITTSTLTVTPNRNMNGQTLKCLAFNYGDTANTVSYQTQLDVRYLSDNKATLNVSSVDIIEGQSVYILCEIKGGNPKATITWDCFTGTTRVVSTADDSRSVITVVGESNQDGQPCTCRGQHDLVSISPAQVIFTVGFAPKEATLTPSGSQTVVEGGDTQPVTCSAKCNPQCNYSWSFKGISTSGATLRLNGIRRNQEGLYTCTARNTFGSMSADVTVFIYYGPNNSVTFDPSQETYTKDENDILRIKCAAECKPNCSFTWILANNKNTTGPILSLSTLKREEQGSYRCVARNIVGESVKAVTISVQYGPADSVTLNPSNQVYTKNENDILPDISCGADCRPSCSYVWMLPSNTNNTGPVLSLSTLNRDEQGTYKCVARNIVGESVKILTISIQYGPGGSIKFNPASSTIIQVENTTLIPVDCSADCRPQCTTTWNSDTGDGNFSNPLSLGELKRNEAGQYTCTATNFVSSNTKSLIVHVKYQPIISSLSYVTIGPNVSEHSAIQIQCKVDSYPRSTIEWTNESGQSLQTDSSSLISTFTINQANCFDTGYYSCSASNGVGAHASQSILINVLCEPRVYNGNNTNNLIAIGKSEQLNVSVKVVANPSPTFEWQFSRDRCQNFKELLNNSDNFLIFNRGKYVVYASQVFQINVRERDFGYYTVLVGNGIGRIASFTMQIIPKRPPDPPFGIQAECVNYNTARITWVSKFDGGTKQTFSIGVKTSKELEFREDESYEDFGQDKTMTGIVNDLKEKTTYFFTVISTNKYGSVQLLHVLECRTPSKEDTCNEIDIDIHFKSAAFDKTDNGPNAASVSLISVAVLLLISEAVVIIFVFVIKGRRTSNAKPTAKSKSDEKGQDESSFNSYEELGVRDQPTASHYQEIRVSDSMNPNRTLNSNMYDELGQREAPNVYEKMKRRKPPSPATTYENTMAQA